MKDEEKTMISVTMRYKTPDDENGVTVERSVDDGCAYWQSFVSATHDALLGLGYILPKGAEEMFECLMDDHYDWKSEDN